MNRRLFLLLLILCALLTLTACGQAAEPTDAIAEPPMEETAEEAAGEPVAESGADDACPQRGGVLHLNFPNPADRFGVPKNIIHYNMTYAQPALEPLLRGGLETGTYDPVLAEDWLIPEDGAYIEWYLRQGVKFHDGSDLNAEVVKWNMDMVLDSPPMRSVESVEVVDEYTFRTHLKFFDVTALSDIGRAIIISKQSFEANGEEWANSNPVGTGPFKISSYERDLSLAYEAFEDYWQPGLPCLDGVEFSMVGDMMTVSAMIQAGEVQTLLGTPTPVIAQLMELLDHPSLDSFVGLHQVIEMNALDPDSIWSDLRMREALEYAIDKESIVEATGFGLNHSVYEIIHSLHSAGGKPNTTPRLYNPDKARELIAEAGYGDGLTVVLTYSTTQSPDQIAILQSNLADVGITLELNAVDPVAMNQLGFEPPEGNGIRIRDMQGGGDPTGSAKQMLGEGSFYFPGIQRPEGFQELLDSALQTRDVTERLALLSQAEELVYNAAILVPLWNRPLLSIDDGSVGGIFYSYGGVPELITASAYLKP